MSRPSQDLDVVADNDNEDLARSAAGFTSGSIPDLEDRFDFSQEPPAFAGLVGNPA